jgi:hypothetical protein
MLKTFTNLPILTFIPGSMRNRWVAALDAIFLVKELPSRVEQSGRSALAWSAQDAASRQVPGAWARRDELKQTVQYAESKKSAAGRREWAQ